MSQFIDMPFVGADYAARSPEFQSQRTVNMYFRSAKPGSKTDSALYSCPGLRLFAQVAAGEARSNGALFDGDCYFVYGDGLYRIQADQTSTRVGTLDTSGGRVVMVAGRSQLLIVDGTAGYTWDGTTFAKITAEGFPPGPTHCTYLDGYFIVNKADSDEFYISGLEDATDWNALDFATAAAAPDNALAVAATFKNLYIIGATTAQVYYDSGAADFPFTPYPGGVFQFGIRAPYSLVNSSAGLFWLATSSEGDAQVVMVLGMESQIVSDQISWHLTSMDTLSDATGAVYRWDGRTVYQLTFPAEKRTFEYYVQDNVWIERSSFGIGRFRGAGCGVLNNTYLFADYANGKLYELDAKVFAEDGEILERMRQTQNLSRDGNRIFWHEVVVDITEGVGRIAGQGEAPQIMLAYSDDGGYTWSSELWRPMGKLGEYRHRVVWRRLGQSRQRIYRLKVTDPVDFTVIGAYARVSLAA